MFFLTPCFPKNIIDMRMTEVNISQKIFKDAAKLACIGTPCVSLSFFKQFQSCTLIYLRETLKIQIGKIDGSNPD